MIKKKGMEFSLNLEYDKLLTYKIWIREKMLNAI